MKIDNITISGLPGGKNIIIDMPSTNPNDWLITRENSLRPERGEFVLKEFRRQYPSIKVKDIEQMYKVCARSQLLSNWLSLVNADYVQDVKIPGYARNIISSTDIENSRKIIDEINNINKNKSAAIKKAADTFKETLDNIENDEAYKLPTNVDKITKILILNTSDMPVSLQLAIENFVPASNDNFPDTKSYARELLFQYKKSLLTMVKNDSSIDIEGVINKAKGK